jgi:hypothetical protein
MRIAVALALALASGVVLVVAGAVTRGGGPAGDGG